MNIRSFDVTDNGPRDLSCEQLDAEEMEEYLKVEPYTALKIELASLQKKVDALIKEFVRLQQHDG